MNKIYNCLKGCIPAVISLEQAKDVVMVMVLICLPIAKQQFVLIAIIPLIVKAHNSQTIRQILV
jgi:hypothetical protein